MGCGASRTDVAGEDKPLDAQTKESDDGPHLAERPASGTSTSTGSSTHSAKRKTTFDSVALAEFGMMRASKNSFTDASRRWQELSSVVTVGCNFICRAAVLQRLKHTAIVCAFLARQCLRGWLHE